MAGECADGEAGILAEAATNTRMEVGSRCLRLNIREEDEDEGCCREAEEDAEGEGLLVWRGEEAQEGFEEDSEEWRVEAEPHNREACKHGEADGCAELHAIADAFLIIPCEMDSVEGEGEADRAIRNPAEEFGEEEKGDARAERPGEEEE